MCKLLVVDDEEMIRVCLGAILEATGHEVVLANDGREAIEKYVKNRDKIELVVMDITMPRMDGVVAARMLKEIDPSLKIVLMSGHTERELNDTDADAFIAKPFRAYDICEIVHQTLGESPALQWEDPVAIRATG